MNMEEQDKKEQPVSLEEEMRQSNALSLPVAIVIAGIVVAGAVLYANGVPRGQQQALVRDAGSVAEESSLRAVSNDDHILGNPNAAVKIVEFSDIECPFCKRFHPTMLRIMDEYGGDGRVAWVYRHFPLEQIHSFAREGALAAECANEQKGNEAFWSFVNEVFGADQSIGSDLFDQAALRIGLDAAKFRNCITSGTYNSRIDADIQDGVTAGVQGTPHSVVIGPDGKQTAINGAQPYEYVKSVVDSLLAGGT